MGRNALVVLLALTTACGVGDLAMNPDARVEPSPDLSLSIAAMHIAESPEGYEATGADVRGLTVTTRMLIRSARVTLEVESLDVAIGAVRQAAARFGGYAAGYDRRVAASWRPQATLTLRVPVEQLDATVTAVTALGRVEEVQLAAQDVSEEFVDVTARLSNAQRLEHRLLDLLSGRTGKLSDVLQVEETLARVRGEIELIEGRRRFLAARSAMSAIELTLHEAGIPVPQPVWGEASDAFGQAWRNFLTLTAVVIGASGVFLPLAIVAVCVWVVVRRVRRRWEPAVATMSSIRASDR